MVSLGSHHYAVRFVVKLEEQAGCSKYKDSDTQRDASELIREVCVETRTNRVIGCF
jgi:hypothetical protein